MLTGIYFLMAFAALQFTRIQGNVSVFWIPSGFAIAVLINYGPNYGLALILGKLLWGNYDHFAVDENIISTLASVSEAYIGYYLYESFKNSINESFDYHKDLILISTISFLAPVISAMIGVTSLLFHGKIPEDQYFFNWIGWYTGDVLGCFIFLPAFIFSKIQSGEDNPKLHFFDFFAPILAAFFTYFFRYEFLNPYIFLLFLTMLIPAVFGSGRALFYSLVTVSLTLNFFLIKHIGPFSAGNYQDNLTSMQFFLFALGFTALGLVGFKRTGLIKRAILPLVSFWILTGAVYYYYHSQKDIIDSKHLEDTVSDFGDRLTEKMIFYKNSLHGVAGFVSSSHAVDQTEWNEYIKSISLINVKEGIRSVALIYPPNSKEKNLFFYDPQIPSTAVSLKYKDTFELNEMKLALKNSFATGELFLTNPIERQLDSKTAMLSYFVMPIYNNDTFIGWIVSAFELNKILNSLIQTGFPSIDIDVYSGKEINAKNLIFKQVIDERFRNNKFDPNKVSAVNFSGQTLTIYWNETSRFISQHNSQNSFFVLIGAIFSLFVTGFILSLRLLNEKAQKLADMKTRELSESEEKFKGLFNNSSDGVIVFNEQKIIDCNPESLSIFGKKSKTEMMLTIFPTLFLQKNDEHLFTKKMKEAKTEGMIFFECECRRNDIAFAAEVHLHHMVFKERYLYQAVVRDISERKKIEANLIRSKELAEEAARAKSNFLSTMSHEIRTPLNGVIGMIDFLLEDTQNQNSPINEDLKTIKYSADNLLHVLNEVLDFSKIEAGKMTFEKKIFSIKNLCDNLVKIYHSKAQAKGIELVLKYDDNLLVHTIGDEYRNTQILHNLISNALKFTNQGRVELRVLMVSKNENFCQVNFKVADTGIGINEEKRRLIFEEFTQAESDHSRKYGGTGLGLSISKRLIEIQKGRLELDSKVNIGSTFTYTLTFAIPTEQEITATNKDNSGEITSFNAQKVLLVEDNDVNIIVTKKFLEKWGLIVEIATNGIEAVEKVKTNSYHLVLMDLHMPLMGGFEATKLIRDFNSTIPIIGLSADVMTEVTHELHATGMNAFVSKPFIPDEFYRKIRSFI
jgi:PAS domain S-box-containing protein